MIGQTVSHYKITAKLGAGGMGEVYLAVDTSLDRRVALKFLPAALSQDNEARERLLREAKAASKLNHPNILTIHSVEAFAGRDFIVMEYVEGQNLSEYLVNCSPSLEDRLAIAIQIVEGLAKAHAAGVIHRDVKPSNILIDADGRAKLLDFGLATFRGATRLTETGSTMGTAAYMSPEQAQSRDCDHRSDLFSLGVVLYEMIAGRLPFEGAHSTALMYSIVNDEPQPLARYAKGIPDELQRIVLKALAKPVGERFQSAGDLISDLKRLSRRGTSSGQHAAVARRRMLAILPFENLGPAEDEYFADGITEEIISRMANLREIGVISRTSAMQYKGTKKSIREIGADLGADFVLEGTIRWGKGATGVSRVRITPQLIRVNEDAHIWAGRYDRVIEDIFDVQSEIAENVAEQLNIKLADPERRAIESKPTGNMDAYYAYLKGRFYWNRRTRDGIAKGIQFFTQAITLDPNYALAHVGLADAYNLLSVYANVPPHDAFPKSKEAASRALEINPTLAEAHTSLAFARCWYDWDWPGGERGFRRAIELSPNYALADYWYSICLMAMGRLGEAEKMARRALEQDPLSIIINASLGWILHGSGRHDEAIEQFIKTLDMDATFARTRWSLGLAYADRGLFDEAIEELRQGVLCSPGSTYVLAALGHVHGRAGQFAEAREVLDKMNGLTVRQYVSPADFAMVYVGLHDLERAIDALERALIDRSSDVLIWARSSRVFELIEHDPRYEAAMRKMGLLQ